MDRNYNKLSTLKRYFNKLRNISVNIAYGTLSPNMLIPLKHILIYP